MTEERMLSIFEDNFYRAINNNEVDKFINGTGEYLIPFKDSSDFERTDSSRTLRGIEYICSKNLNVSSYIETQLLNMLESNNIENTYGVLSLVTDYIRRDKSKEYSFNIDLKNMLEKLKIKLLEQRNQMKEFKSGVFKNNDNGMYDVVENMAIDFEIQGHKIL